MEAHHPGCGVLAAPCRRRRNTHYHDNYFKGCGVAFTSEARRNKSSVAALMSIVRNLEHLPEDQQVLVLHAAMVRLNCVRPVEDFTEALREVIARDDAAP